MDDREYARERKRVGGIFRKWVHAFGMDLWQKVDIEFFREALPPYENDGKTRDEMAAVAADCKASWKYRTAWVRVCLPRFAEMDDNQADYIIRHELCHALVNEM